MTATATADVSFDYEILPIRDLQVTTEVNKKNGRQEVTSVTVAGQNLAPTDRFWTSLFARYGFNKSIFNFYNHAEVFSRISDRMSNDRMRLCIQRGGNTSSRNPDGTLLAVSNPAKPFVGYDELRDLVGRFDSEKVTYANGVIESTHQPRTTYGNTFSVGADEFQNRFVLSCPIDGYGQPNVYLAMLRLLCTNGAIGYSRAFRSQIALGKAEDNVMPQLIRVLEGFGNDEGYAALRGRFEAAQKSWASVYEAVNLQRTLYKLYGSHGIDDHGGTALPKGTSIASWFAKNRNQKWIGDGDDDAVMQAPIFRSFENMTGNPTRLYGLANLDALSSKRQRTLPVECTTYDLINFATEVATHYADPSAARRLQAWVGETVSNEYDMENTKDAYTEFKDFHLDAKVGQGLTGSEPSAN